MLRKFLSGILFCTMAVPEAMAFGGTAVSLGARDQPITWGSLWYNSAIANSGAPTTTRRDLNIGLIKSYQASGSWVLKDDILMLVAEDGPSALTSWKRRTLATAVATPTFTIDRGYAFNGTSQYIDTLFNPSTMAASMTLGNIRIAIYERTNVAANTTSMGCINSATISMRTRNSTDQLATTLMTGQGTVASVTDSRGLTATSRAGNGTTAKSWKAGSALADVTGLTPNGSSLVNRTIAIAARNNTAADQFRASTAGYADWGAPESTTQEGNDATVLQTYMTTLGAQVP